MKKLIEKFFKYFVYNIVYNVNSFKFLQKFQKYENCILNDRFLKYIYER